MERRIRTLNIIGPLYYQNVRHYILEIEEKEGARRTRRRRTIQKTYLMMKKCLSQVLKSYEIALYL